MAKSVNFLANYTTDPDHNSNIFTVNLQLVVGANEDNHKQLDIQRDRINRAIDDLHTQIDNQPPQLSL